MRYLPPSPLPWRLPSHMRRLRLLPLTLLAACAPPAEVTEPPTPTPDVCADSVVGATHIQPRLVHWVSNCSPTILQKALK